MALLDGTLVIGAPLESSGATGINPLDGQGDDGIRHAGAVYVFR